MEEITVSEQNNHPFMNNLYEEMRETLAYLPFESEKAETDDRTTYVFKTDKKYSTHLMRYAEENVADVIAIGYKYSYFKKHLALPFLTEFQKEILYVSIVSADYLDDKKFIFGKIKNKKEYCIDGIFHFILPELQARWQKICGYIPLDFSESTLQSFVSFIIDEGEGKAFLKEGVLYDEEYRPLCKGKVLGKHSPTTEIILSGARNVYCFGKPDFETENFLKKYYKEKAVFC